jgi:Berberine and berberine like
VPQPNPEHKLICTRWLPGLTAEDSGLAEYAGVHVLDEGTGRIEAAYGPEKYARLVALKNKYDPTNLLRLNQNIKPSRATLAAINA